MSWSLGILFLRRAALVYLGTGDGVCAMERLDYRQAPAEQLQKVFREWRLAPGQIANIFLAVPPCFEKLLPPNWHCLHLRQSTYPMDQKLLLPGRLAALVQVREASAEDAEALLSAAAGTDLVTVISSFAPLFKEKEVAWKERLQAAHPEMTVACSGDFPMLNFLQREKTLLYRALAGRALQFWLEGLVQLFGEDRPHCWWVEDEALFWEWGREVPQGAGLRAEAIVYLLMARGLTARDMEAEGVVVYRLGKEYSALAVNGYQVSCHCGGELFGASRFLSRLKVFLKNSRPAGREIVVYNLTGQDLNLGYPFREKKEALSPVIMGMGLFRSPLRARGYALCYRQDSSRVRAQLEDDLRHLNSSYSLFDKPRVVFQEMPLRYLNSPSSFITAVISSQDERCS